MATLCSLSTTDVDTNSSATGEVMHVIYLSLGSNLGDRHAAMKKAVELIGKLVGTVDRRSSLIETEPWGFESPNRFLNMCVRVRSKLTPFEVLDATQHIERELGRTKKSDDGHYHDRPIDIDILTYDNISIDSPRLTIPHPHMRERDFVMVPLREILD